jgi:peptide/nickel transport system substrate-binding protein
MGNINAGAILPRESTEAQADVRDGVSGSGPMRLADGVSTDLARLERVEGDTSPSLVDAMEWRRLEGASELAAAFADRSIDVLVGGERNGVASDGAEVVIEPGLSWTSIGLRVDRPPFADERVRRALDLAIDRAALMSEAGATDGALAGPVNQHLAGGYWSLPREEIRAAQGADLPPEARIAEARMLLEAAGVRDTTVELQVASTPELIDLAALVREQLLPFGIQLNTVQLALPAWFFNFRGGNFHATLINHPPYETADPSLRLYHTQGAEGGGNAFGYSSPAIDWLVERSWAEEDREQRRATVLEAQRLMIEARPLLHLFSAPAYSVVRTYVRDHGLHLPGSLARYHYRQWLDLPADGRPD